MAGYKALVLLFFLYFLCISDASTIGKYSTYHIITNWFIYSNQIKTRNKCWQSTSNVYSPSCTVYFFGVQWHNQRFARSVRRCIEALYEVGFEAEQAYPYMVWGGGRMRERNVASSPCTLQIFCLAKLLFSRFILSLTMKLFNIWK